MWLVIESCLRLLETTLSHFVIQILLTVFVWPVGCTSLTGVSCYCSRLAVSVRRVVFGRMEISCAYLLCLLLPILVAEAYKTRYTITKTHRVVLSIASWWLCFTCTEWLPISILVAGCSSLLLTINMKDWSCQHLVGCHMSNRLEKLWMAVAIVYTSENKCKISYKSC